MAGKKSLGIMTSIKRAMSPLKPRIAAGDGVVPSLTAEHTPLTRFVMDRLTGPSKELFALSFAVQMKVDKHAVVFDLADCLPWIGIGRIDNAVRLLSKHFTEGQYRVETVFLPKEENLDKGGRRPKRHLISLDTLEDLMMQAETEQGRKARTMYKQLRDAVQDYMRLEMETASRIATEETRQAQQRLEEQTTRLAIEEAKRAELEAVQARLQATIESQKKREEKKEARKRQQKEPLETAYIMTNMPDDSQGPYKCGKTGGDAKKRAKDMQTGNHEAMRVVASAKCVDSKLVEDVMHRIFRDYRTNDKLEWFDTNLKSMHSVLKFVVEMIDGLNQVDHDEVCVEEHLNHITMLMRERVLNLPPHAHAETDEIVEDAEQLTNDVHPLNESPVKDFIELHLCLSRDKREPRYHHKATSLYNHYVTTIPSVHQALNSDEFFKNTKIILKDNYKNAGLNVTVATKG